MRTRHPALLVLAVLAFLASPVDAGPGKAPSKAQTRVDTAEKAYEIAAALYQHSTPEIVYRWSVAWLDSQRDLPLKGKALEDAAQAHLDRMVSLEKIVTDEVKAGRLPQSAQTFAAYYHAEADVWVERKGKR